ncbi:MAG: hypothetical protein ACRDSM_21385 [Pseudonocardiaceae bacterium]
MEHGAVRKLTRAVILSLFVLATTSGVAVVAASPAMAAPDGQGGGSDSGKPGDPIAPVTKIVNDITGSGGGSAPGSRKAADPTAAVIALAGGIAGGGVLGHS